MVILCMCSVGSSCVAGDIVAGGVVGGRAFTCVGFWEEMFCFHLRGPIARFLRWRRLV